MNESTLVQLKILVERAVRPVRASSSRKRKMREELLAHVSGVFEEEAKPGDEMAALERTRVRFGNPAELTGQLQQTVGLNGRIEWIFDSLLYPKTKSPWRRAVRHANLFLGAFLVIPMLNMAIPLAMQLAGQEGEGPASSMRGMLKPSLLLAYIWVMTYAASVVAQKTSQAIHGPADRFWPCVVPLAIVTAVGTALSSLGFPVAVTLEVRTSISETLWLLPALAVLSGYGLLFLARTARCLFHGTENQSLLRIWVQSLVELAFVSALIIGLNFAIVPDAWTHLPQLQGIGFLLAAMVVFFNLALSWRAKMAEFRTAIEQQLSAARADEEWANLQLG